MTTLPSELQIGDLVHWGTDSSWSSRKIYRITKLYKIHAEIEPVVDTVTGESCDEPKNNKRRPERYSLTKIDLMALCNLKLMIESLIRSESNKLMEIPNGEKATDVTDS